MVCSVAPLTTVSTCVAACCLTTIIFVLIQYIKHAVFCVGIVLFLEVVTFEISKSHDDMVIHQ